MKLNEDKCHLMVFGDKCNDVTLNIGSITIKEEYRRKVAWSDSGQNIML